MNCIIVDDEPLAQRIIERYINELPDLSIIAKCNDALEALDILKANQVDLIFLDINMPRLNGINFLKTNRQNVMTIITTAYSEYALESYELNVIDYLKKPFSFERFLKATEKAFERYNLINKNLNDTDEIDQIFVKVNKKSININIDNILYVEALGDYIKIHTTEKSYVTYQSLKGFVKMLPSKKFYRIHKSFIVALSKISEFYGNTIKIDNKELPLGNNYKQGFLKAIHPS
ncbi:MAG: LytTR family DNA-binding domain-containing protein [Marinifilaceae bacterium]|jgi:DNA-binding LytR/AlgR family response regulator|nr:LytTR family DNA-binding domain-containing protein [Marinifilaceae bacterium]